MIEITTYSFIPFTNLTKFKYKYRYSKEVWESKISFLLRPLTFSKHAHLKFFIHVFAVDEMQHNKDVYFDTIRYRRMVCTYNIKIIIKLYRLYATVQVLLYLFFSRVRINIPKCTPTVPTPPYLDRLDLGNTTASVTGAGATRVCFLLL